MGSQGGPLGPMGLWDPWALGDPLALEDPCALGDPLTHGLAYYIYRPTLLNKYIDISDTAAKLRSRHRARNVNK